MAGINFTLNFEDVEKIQQAINDYGDNVEDIINQCIHQEGKDRLIRSIENCMPVSDRNKKHAKFSNSLTNKDRKSTRLNSSHITRSRMPSSA